MTAIATAVQFATDRDHQRRTLSRQRAERLLRLAESLPAGDRALLKQVFEHGQSAAEIARLAQQNPQTVRRRVRQLLRRVESPMYRFVAGHLDMLPRELQPTARRHILEGLSLRQTALATGQTLHRVRRHRQSIETRSRFL